MSFNLLSLPVGLINRPFPIQAINCVSFYVTGWLIFIEEISYLHRDLQLGFWHKLLAAVLLKSRFQMNLLINTSLKLPERYENDFWSRPRWRENPYLHLLAGESGQCLRRLRMNLGIKILLLPRANGLLEGGWTSRDQCNCLSSGWETLHEDGWATSWPTAWICGNEWGILLHYYFSWKDLKFYIKKKRERTP